MQKERDLLNYELAPTNGMHPDKLARYYGYESAVDFANSLPEGARVIDIGAGISDFGRVIATARKDVSVTYLDLRYNDAAILAKAQGDNDLPNVSYIQGDILNIENSPLALGTYDRVYSSRLIPHIELDDSDLARTALSNMGKLLNDNGEMVLLCRFFPLLRDRFRPKTVRITKQELQNDADSVISKAISEIRLPVLHRTRQRLWNTTGKEYFGGDQWRLPDSRGRIHPMRGELWSPKRQEFVRRSGLHGQIIYTSFWMHSLKNTKRALRK